MGKPLGRERKDRERGAKRETTGKGVVDTKGGRERRSEDSRRPEEEGGGSDQSCEREGKRASGDEEGCGVVGGTVR